MSARYLGCWGWGALIRQGGWFLLKLDFTRESEMGLGEGSDPRLFVISHLDEGKGSLGALREEVLMEGCLQTGPPRKQGR